MEIVGKRTTLCDSSPKTRREAVLEVMRDGRARSPQEIRELTRATKLDSLLHQMWRTGDLLASQKVNAFALEKRGSRFAWVPKRMRFYVRVDEGPKTLEVSYPRWNKKFKRNETVVENLVFNGFDPSELGKRDKIMQKIMDLLASSDFARFSDEIARELGANIEKVRRELSYIKRRGLVRSKGQFNPYFGKETTFSRGYLWFTQAEQYSTRIAKHDVLDGCKQRIFKTIETNTKVQRRFTPKTELFGSRGSRNEGVMKELCSVYVDVKAEDIAGETFYYLDGALSGQELAAQRAYWQQHKSQKSSIHNRLGHAHEAFFSFAMQRMWESGEFRVERADWLFHIGPDGQKKYNYRVPRRSNPRELAEFDRILFIDFAPFSDKEPRRVYLVFESKYKQRLDTWEWDKYLRKIGDTFEFGTVMTLTSARGEPVRVYAPKANVVPIIVVPHVGRGEDGQNFAKYVISQGGLVLFTSEFEGFLRKKTGKHFTFRSLFDTSETKSEQKEFLDHLREFFGAKEEGL